MIIHVPGAVAPPMAPAGHRLIPGHPDAYRVTVPADRRPHCHRCTRATNPCRRAAVLVEIARPRPRAPREPWWSQLLRILRGPNWA